MEKKCIDCNASFQFETGRPGQPPKRCPECRNPRDSARKPIDIQAAYERKNIKRRKKDENSPDRKLAMARKLAWFLGDGSDPQSRARSIGLGSVENLDEIIELARTEFPDLVARENTALAALFADAMFLQTINLIDNYQTVAPSVAANAVRSLAMAREVLVGAGQGNDFAQVQVVIKAPDGSDIDLIESVGSSGQPN